jgi:hypothetical protein
LRHSSHPTQSRLGKPPPVIVEEKQEDIGSGWKNASRPHLFAWSPESLSIEGKSPKSPEQSVSTMPLWLFSGRLTLAEQNSPA